MSKEKSSHIPGTASMVEESSLGFPIGRVAQSISKVIGPNLSNHDVEGITVVLVRVRKQYSF
jgi:hypothetical protein